MRPFVVLAALGQPCSTLTLSIDPETLGDGLTEADVTCDAVSFAEATPTTATCACSTHPATAPS